MANKLHNHIMRRVYYVYGIRLVTSPGVVYGFAMLAMLILLTRFVSIGNVLYNLRYQQINNLGNFFYNALTHTEVWTLVILGAMIFTALSLRWQLRTPEYKRVRTA